MKTHPFDAISFVFGLLFAGLGAVFILAPNPWLAMLDLRWSWVLPLIVIGAGLWIVRSLIRTKPQDVTTGEIDDSTSSDLGSIDRDLRSESEHDELLSAHEALTEEIPPVGGLPPFDAGPEPDTDL